MSSPSREVMTSSFSRLKSILQTTYPKLFFFDGRMTTSSPFLHIWKPVLDDSFHSQGSEFLPSFHVIVKIREDSTNYAKIDKENRPAITKVLAELYSFHGKLLLEEAISLDDLSDGAGTLKLLEDLENDRLQVCQGVQDIKTMNLELFLRSCKLPTHEKIKSLFLIEQLSGEIIYRSRLCNFVVYNAVNPKNPDAEDFVRCSECSAYNQEREISFFTYLKKVKNGDFDEAFHNLPNLVEAAKKKTPASLEVEERNLFMRVYLDTTEKDKNLNKALSTYKAFSKYGLLQKELPSEIKKEKVDAPDLVDDYEMKEDDRTVAGDEFVETKLEIVSTDVDVERLIGLQATGIEIKVSKKDPAVTNLSPMETWDSIKVKDEDPLATLFSKPKGSNTKKLSAKAKEEEKLKKAAERKRNKVEQRRRQRAMDRLNGVVRYPNRFMRPCPVCLHMYKAPSLVQNCMNRHEEELNLDVPVRCPMCMVEIESKKILTQHFSDVHGDTGKTCCCECLIILPLENNRLRRHFIKTHHSAGKKSICPLCGKCLSSERELRIHMEDHDGNVAVCHHCGETFHQRKKLGLHLARNHLPRDLKCPYCEQMFENKDQASRHLAMHSGYKPFRCPDCSYCSYKMYNVHTHVNKTHGKKSRLEDMVIDEEAREKMSQMVKADVTLMLAKRREQRKNKQKELSS